MFTLGAFCLIRKLIILKIIRSMSRNRLNTHALIPSTPESKLNSLNFSYELIPPISHKLDTEVECFFPCDLPNDLVSPVENGLLIVLKNLKEEKISEAQLIAAELGMELKRIEKEAKKELGKIYEGFDS